MSVIRLEYIKRYEEEERYYIYYRERKIEGNIVISHIGHNITFDRFDTSYMWCTKEIVSEIFKLAEEYIIPEYEGYKVWRNNVIGNILYWEWKGV